MSTGKAPKRPWYHRGWLVALFAVIFVAVGAAVIILAPRPLAGYWESSPNVSGVPTPSGSAAPAPNESAGRTAVAAAAQTVQFSLGGVIAVVDVALSLLRHGRETDAAELERERSQTDDERVLRDRFVTAVELLGATEPIKRTAGLYAMTAIADTWHALDNKPERQVCIDVLCAYLRAPLTPKLFPASAAAPDQESPSGTNAPEKPRVWPRTPPAEVEVRKTGYALVRARLQSPDNGPSRWGDATFDLTGAQVDHEVNLRRTRLHSHGSQLGQFGLPQPGPVAVGAAAVGGDQ